MYRKRNLSLFCFLIFGTVAEARDKLPSKKDNEGVCDNKNPLILTPYIRQGKIDEALRLAEVNEKYFLGFKSYSGFMTVKDEYNSNLFFWYFPVTAGDPKDFPLVIWLNGGPGASSLYGLFAMNGPFLVKGNSLILRPITWVHSYSMLYIDNPAGAGFSFTEDERGYLDNENDVGDQLFNCLDQFLNMFPDLRKAPLFVAGESYAGKYVPALAIQIHRRRTDSEPINLKGIAIGNGLIDPRNMMHYTPLCAELGLLDGDELTNLRCLEKSVIRFIDKKQMVNAANAFNKTIEYIKKYSGVNIYNFDTDPSKSAHDFEAHLNLKKVRGFIHVGNVSFDFDNQRVYNKMLPDIMDTVRPFVEELLKSYGVMCYSGQLDVILPYAASKHVYSKFNYPERNTYLMAKRQPLRDDKGNVFAYARRGGNFLEVLVRHAGHDVSAAPEAFKYIMDYFVNIYRR